ncbi:WD repeat-containing protein 25 isoform X3 [Rhinoderma darwinii]|uniref:WD repeat-containing protein 25 isoform X3 n=1 Tax=Rhinoderma darwinii TaxID=43563 RepID=UPI003F6796D7
MNSLVAYDDSDSETEDGRRSHTPQVAEALATPLVPHQPQIDAALHPTSMDTSVGSSSFGKDFSVTEQYRVRAASCNSTYKGLSNSAKEKSVFPAPKRPQLGGEGAVKPYVPKRLRQEQSNMADAVEGGALIGSHDRMSHSVRNIYRVSDYLGPYLPLKYSSGGIPKKVIFQMEEHSGPVNRVQWCPVKQYGHLLLSASMDGTCKEIHVYTAAVQQHFDLLFLADGREFLSTTDCVSRDSADRTIIAWDFATTAKISNQIFHERYTCPSLALHPKENVFAAQTNGNYIALFSTQRPYKINKKRRFEGHKVVGFAVGCEFSPDGSIVVTGSSEGSVVFYNYHTSKIIQKLPSHGSACVGVNYHSVVPSLLATCYWDGMIQIWE